MSKYEVWCHACNVTFPAETKRCLHCGGRTRPDPPRRSMRGVVEERAEMFVATPISYGGERAAAAAVDADRQASEDPLEPEEEPARRSFLRSGMTFVWMILLAAGYAWRACSQ